MTQFPNAIPDAGSAVTTDTLAQAGHTSLHNGTQNEVRAIAQKVGTGNSTPADNQVLKGTGAGTSSWGQVDLENEVTGVLPVGSGGLGQNSLSGLSLPNATLNEASLTGTPEISDFSQANHNHENSAGGGTLGANALQDNSITTSKVADSNITSEKLSATIAFKAYRSAAFIIAGGGGFAKMNLDGEVFDLGNDYDNTTNYRFNAPVDGLYFFNANLVVSNAGLSEQAIVAIYVNGALNAFNKSYGTSASDDPATCVSTLVQLSAGDYVEYYADATADVDVDTGSESTFFMGYLVGRT